MATYDPKNFSKSPYFDDYDETKKFLRILFKPGRAVQVRELSQLQSISQNQMTRLSNHFFKEGSQIFDGQLADIKCRFLRVEKQYDGVDIDVDNFKNSTISLLASSESQITGDVVTSPVRAKILHIESATASDPYHIFFITYEESDTEFTNSNVLTKISYNTAGKVVNTQYRCTVKTALTSADSIYTTGDSVLISNDEGIFYTEGFFVLASKQTIPLYKTARRLSTILSLANPSASTDGVEIENTTAPGELPQTTQDSVAASTNFVAYETNESLEGIRLFQFPTARVGFNISQQAVESTEDVTLLDNSFGSYNYSAPGGDRYKIELTLSQLAIDNDVNLTKLADYTTDDFLEKLRIIDGSVSYIEKYPTYSNFEETLARRTFDESGNYTVRPFEVELREYFRDDRYVLTRSTPIDGSSNTTFYTKGQKIIGRPVGNTGATWYGIVVHNDTFLDRENEQIVTDAVGVEYATTVIYLLQGTPLPGDEIRSYDETTDGVKNSLIMSDDAFNVATSPIPLPDGSVYKSKFSPVQLIADSRNGLYSLSRLAPAVDNALTIVTESKEKLAVGVGTGKAYIFGYEFENQSPEYIQLNKSRITKTETDQQVVNSIGNFVLCDLATDVSPEAGYKNPTSHYYVELWGGVSGWTGNDGNTSVAINGALEKKGSARVRGINYNFRTSDIVNEKLIQVYLYDIQMDAGGDYFTDCAQIRIPQESGATSKIHFEINKTFGVEHQENYTSEGTLQVVGGNTIIYDPKNNHSLFCIPTNNSVKFIRSLDSFETTKSFTGGEFKGNVDNGAGGALNYIQFASADGYYITIPHPPHATKLNDEWHGSNTSGMTAWPTGWTGLSSPFGSSGYTTLHNLADTTSLDSLQTRYSLINESTGQIFDLSDTTKFFVSNVKDEKDKLTIWAADGVIVDLSHKHTLVASVDVLSADAEMTTTLYDATQYNRKKTLKDAYSLKDTATPSDFETYFTTGGTSAGAEIKGYYKLTLKNANIGEVYGNITGNQNFALYWGNPAEAGGMTQGWTQGAGTAGDFIGNDLPKNYATSLGVSDVDDVTEILVWYRKSNGEEYLKDITAEFEFEDGTNDNIYNHAKVAISRRQLETLKKEDSDGGRHFTRGTASGSDFSLDCTLFVRFKFYEHSGSGPIIVNSYNHENHHPSFEGYEDIPVHTSPAFGSRMELRNCLDYRPVRKNIGSKDIVEAHDSLFVPKLDTSAPIVDNFADADTNSTAYSATSLLKPSSIVSTVSPKQPQLDYDIYLARMDKLVLRKTRKFDILNGESAFDPTPPVDDDEAMTLYSLIVPEYTYNAEDIKITYIDHQRFTMEDIAKLEKRIEKIEYYTSLNLLEKETEELSITDGVDGMERFKNGILVDSFKGHSVGDVLHRDYNCSIDFENGELRPKFTAYNMELVSEAIDSSADVVKSPDGLVTLRYKGDGKGADTTATANPPRWLVQPVASRAISVNPFNVTNWLGAVKLSPSSDTWKDTNRKPTVKINLEGENDAWEAMGAKASGTQWNDWETGWTGSKVKSQSVKTSRQQKYLDAPHTRRAPDGRLRRRLSTSSSTVTKTTSITTKKQTRTGIRTTIVPERVTKNLGDKIVDVSVIPFIRTRAVTINTSGMKPNTQVYPFFDGVDVNQYCNFDNTTGGTITTDDTGKVSNLIFSIPAGIFKTGEREFRLTDSSSNNVKNATTAAEANYFAQGILQTKQSTVVSTRVPTLRRQTVSDSKVVRDVVTRTKVTEKNEKVKWVDPLAQTFLVDDQQEPDGVWIHSVDLFLARKPANGIPITVQIRPTVNGYPHSSMVLPFAEAVVDQKDVRTSKALTTATIPNPDNADTYTRFKFSSPVYLTPNEYSLVVMSNSDEYECYIAEMGEERVGPSTERITQQPYAGVFFKSQNASTWSADQNVDLMFAINKCEFTKSSSGNGFDLTFQNSGIDDFTGTSIQANNIKIVSENVSFDASPIKALIPNAIELAGQAVDFEVPLNENIEFDSPVSISTSGADAFNLKINIDSSNSGLTPVLDLDRFSMLAINNVVENDDSWQADESAPFAPTTTSAQNRTRYITRRVELDDGLEADDFKVFLTGHKPLYYDSDGNEYTTSIRVWLKAQSVDDNRAFEDLPWMEMELDSAQANLYSEEAEEMYEYEYLVKEKRYNADTGTEVDTGYSRQYEMFSTPITRYAFKITLHSGNSSYIPRIKDFRTIAVT